jgi:hypothetical protein
MDVFSALRRFLESAPACSDLLTLTHALDECGCNELHGRITETELCITIHPPILAHVLAEALGWGDVLVWPRHEDLDPDVDMHGWRLQRVVTRDLEVIQHAQPRAGRWVIEAILDDDLSTGPALTMDGGCALGKGDIVGFLVLSKSNAGIITSEIITPELLARIDASITGFVREPGVRDEIISLGRQCIPGAARLPDLVFAPVANCFAWHALPLVELWEFMRDVGASHGDGELYIVAPERRVDPGRAVIRIGTHALQPAFRSLIGERLQHDGPSIEWVFGRERRFAMFADHEAGLVVTATTRPYFHFEEARGADSLVPFQQVLEHAASRIPPHELDAWRSRLIASYPSSWPRVRA